MARSLLTPNLKSAGLFDFGLMVEIKGIKHQLFAAGVEDPSVRFSRLVFGDIENVGNVELPRTHQLADVFIGREILSLALNELLLVAICRRQSVDLFFKRSQLEQRFVTFRARMGQFGLCYVVRLLFLLSLAGKGDALLCSSPQLLLGGILVFGYFGDLVLGRLELGLQLG